MTAKTIPYFEVELAAYPITPETVTFLALDGKGQFVYRDRLILIPVAHLQPGSKSARAVRDNIYAEVNIPYRADRGSDDDAGYTYTFHLFNKPNFMPAIPEIVLLQEMIAAIHADFSHLAVRRGMIEVDDE